MHLVQNYLPEQYEQTNPLCINHNYLPQQFADVDAILAKVREVVVRGDFTLGRAVDRLEGRIAELCETRHAIGVGSGTDALFLTLKALGIDKGDEVITTPFTFYATIGAIVTAGATPVFADAGLDCNLDPSRIEEKITARTKAILPVHWSGLPCDMGRIGDIANRHGLAVVEDACHAIKGRYKNRATGSLGTAGCFSFHPLKNLNVWGDAGAVTTDDDDLAERLRLLRNHGLAGRNECRVFAYNSRLDTVQAVVADHLLDKLDHITTARIANARRYDECLRGIRGVVIPDRPADRTQVYHLYVIRCERRDELLRHLVAQEIDAKVHYPVPMHLQPAAAFLNHRRGDFPIAEALAGSVLSLPAHEFVSEAQQRHVANLVRAFYA